MTSLLDTAIDLADQGIANFPCLFGSKSPAIPRDQGRGFLDASTVLADLKRMYAFPGAALIGVPTGAINGFTVVDLDPRAGSDEWIDAARLPITRTHRTRSGGRHLIFQAVPGLRSSASRVAPGVDIRSEGGYIIWWPAHGFEATDDPIAVMPEWLIEMAQAPVRKTVLVDQAEHAPSTEAVVSLLDRLPNPATNGRDVWAAVMLAAIGCCSNPEIDVDEVGEAACRWAARWPGSLGYDIEWAKWEADWQHRNKPLAGWRNLKARAAREIPGYAVEAAAAEFPPVEPGSVLETGSWHDRLQRGRPGKDGALGPVYGNLLNARTALESLGVLQFNSFEDRIRLIRRPPWHVGAVFQPADVKDPDYSEMTMWLQAEGIQVTTPVVKEAAVVVARGNQVNPVQDYLNGLRHDGAGRIDRWLIDHAGAEDTPLNRAIGAKFLISMVARALKPGCKVDSFLVLEGRQGLRKSGLFHALAGGSAWFTDHIPDLATKEAALQLQGKWLIEMAEMHTLNRADMARAKAFISTSTDRFRRPYGHASEDVPRQSVMCGTLNPGGSGYLRDETGNRRFWPVTCAVNWGPEDKIDVKAVAAVRDQLFAEAVARYHAGETWWLDTAALEQDQTRAADARYFDDAWAELVSRHLAGKNEVSLADILTKVLDKPKERWSDADTNRVGRILRKLGWTPKQVRVNGVRVSRYFRDGEPVVVPISPTLMEMAS